MNIAHTRKIAAAGAKFCGYSLVRRLGASLLIGAACMASATAGPGNRDREAYRAAQQRAEQDMARQYNDRERDRQIGGRESARADDRRRDQYQQQEQGNNDARRSGRLTPDERRDLRRQINEAGNDIYPDRRRR